MATLSLQRLCLLLLLPFHILALDCITAAENQLRVNNPEVLKFIEAMGGQQLPEGCLYKRPTFKFPGAKTFRANKEGKSMAVKVILGNVLQIFEHNFTRAGWDAGSIALLQNALFQQSNQWKNCSTAETGEEAALTNQDLNLNLRRYFRQIQTFLENQQYGLCAWSVVRLEIWWLFSNVLDQLLHRF